MTLLRAIRHLLAIFAGLRADRPQWGEVSESTMRWHERQRERGRR